jgi:RES domain-containing protein
MHLFRICKTKFAHDLTGEGAKLYGGRWNQRMTACVYASSSRALAILEYSVHVQAEDIPRALSIITIAIPDHIAVLTPTIGELPGNWKDVPASAEAKKWGTDLLQSCTHAVIKVPSAIIPQEYNFILNPLHPDSTFFSIDVVEDFAYDLRIK